MRKTHIFNTAILRKTYQRSLDISARSDRLLAKITRPEHIKINTNILHRYYAATTDILHSNSYYKKRKYIYNTIFNRFFNTLCIS